jgi:hypothetical protein
MSMEQSLDIDGHRYGSLRILDSLRKSQTDYQDMK